MRRSWLLLILLALAACGGGHGRMAYGPGRMDYPEPGPAGDPWRPYIRDASRRFSVPNRWIRAVMQQESGGHEYRYGRPITSSAGAMGLMQLMPATYADMQDQNGLGSDPYEPHDNILAGAAYIRLMYARYGAPGFLAAYNAGPQRLDDYLGRGRRLPNETVNYVASISPHLGSEIAMTGPLSSRRGVAPGAPARMAPAPIRLASYRLPAAAGRAGCYRNPDAAYDPGAPCSPPPRPAAASYAAAPAYRAPAHCDWAIQVGAYASTGQAHLAAMMARQAAYGQLSGSRSLVETTSRFGGAVLYRARLAGLEHVGAGAACAALEQHGIPCMIVAPGG